MQNVVEQRPGLFDHEFYIHTDGVLRYYRHSPFSTVCDRYVEI